MPAIRAFDHPPPRRVAGCRRLGAGAAPRPGAASAPCAAVAARLGRLVGLREVEALIPTQVLRVPGGRGGARDHHAVQDGLGQLHVGAVRRAEDDAQGRAAAVVEDMPFGAQFAPIGRVRARRVAAEGGKGPSHCRSTASPSQCGAPHHSGATAPPTGGPTRPAASTPGSGRGPSSPSRTPGGRPSTGSRCAGRAGSRPAPAETAPRGARGCRAAFRAAAARGSPPREHRASARWSARPWPVSLARSMPRSSLGEGSPERTCSGQTCLEVVLRQQELASLHPRKEN